MSLREKIAELCCEHEGQEWESLIDEDAGLFCKPRFRRDALCVLESVRSEIEKAGLDPKQPKDVHIANYRMGKETQQAHILKILEEK